MATGQTMLNWMEVLFPELQLQSGESDVTKGLMALNAAQDMFETHVAQYGESMFGGTVGTIVTVANQEYTTYPTGLLRVDQIDMLGDDSLPIYTLRPEKAGGQATRRWWWNLAVSGGGSGRPGSYWTNGNRIYWDPIPDAVYSLRYYGFVAAQDIAADGTYTYPDATILPLSTLAAKFLRIGVDDPIENYQALAMETFNGVLDQMSGFRRDAPAPYVYTRTHET